METIELTSEQLAVIEANSPSSTETNHDIEFKLFTGFTKYYYELHGNCFLVTDYDTDLATIKSNSTHIINKQV